MHSLPKSKASNQTGETGKGDIPEDGLAPSRDTSFCWSQQQVGKCKGSLQGLAAVCQEALCLLAVPHLLQADLERALSCSTSLLSTRAAGISQ